jgi:hypothetical protein
MRRTATSEGRARKKGKSAAIGAKRSPIDPIGSAEETYRLEELNGF